jgi:hypothetical protein
LDIGGKIILKQILDKYNAKCGLDSSASGKKLVGCCEDATAISGSVKCCEILEQLRDCWLL